MLKLNGMKGALAATSLILGAAVGFGGAARAQAVVAQARAALPDSARKSGVLNIATALQWAPFAYSSEKGEPTGIDVNLMKVLAAKLGLRVHFDDLKFPSIIPGVLTGRYDVGVNQIGITPERLKVISLLPYFNTGYSLTIRKGAPPLDVNNLCGKTLALTTGSIQRAVVEQLSAKCARAGKPQITRLFYPSSADTYMAVASGRGDGFLTARAAAVYVSRNNARLYVAPGMLNGWSSLSGIAVRKDNPALYRALLLALESAIADGSYAAILNQYGAADGVVSVDRIKAAEGS